MMTLIVSSIVLANNYLNVRLCFMFKESSGMCWMKICMYKEKGTHPFRKVGYPCLTYKCLGI